jgi:hypothetical protein
MTPFRHHEADGTALVLTDDGFDAIPIRQAEGVMYSYWRPTLADRLRILFGAHVGLGVSAQKHPHVTLQVKR